MTDTWGKVAEADRRILRSGMRSFSEAEIAERFVAKGKGVAFRAIRKTDRAFALPSDSDLETGRSQPVESYEMVEIPLIAAEDFDYVPKLTDEDRAAAKPIETKMAALKGAYEAGVPLAAGEGESAPAQLPVAVDHRAEQSPVKDQGGRGTCVAHASMGLLESFPHINDNLSEQYTHYKFNAFEGKPQELDSGLKTTDSAVYLARNDGRTCLESEWPYIPDQPTIAAMVANGTYCPPPAAVRDQTYGIGAYKIIEDKGLTGDSIKNTLYLEALIYRGYNVVIGVWASWDDKDNNGILEPVLDPNGQPVGKAGHAMLVVGYDRARQYFIVKNSWRNTWGHQGYGHFHYNFVRSCAKYGYVVDAVTPAAPSKPVPAKLVSAPYSTDRIGRAALRAAVVLFKTSRGRYAVAEAYAGDNLYLHNLRVYNPDGSVHLTKDTLVVRGTYLCDLDTGREQSSDADFWWEAVSPGVNFLVPRNGAAACIGYNLAALTPAQIDGWTLTSAPVASAELSYAVVVGRTTAGRRFKLLAQAKTANTLELAYVEVYNADGSRCNYGRELKVRSSWTYNLDQLQQGGGSQADIWWHVISDNVGFLEKYSTAATRLIWRL